MMPSVLQSPKRLPARYNRRVQPRTLDLVRKRHGRHRQYSLQRWSRSFRRTRERWAKGWSVAVRFSPWIALCAIALVVAVALFSPLLEIREIRLVRTDRRVDVERVQRSLKPLFGKHILFVTPKDVIPLLATSVPDLRKATIDTRYPSTLILRLDVQSIVARLEIVDPSGVVSTVTAGTGADAMGDYLTSDGMYVTYPSSLVQSGTGTAVVRIVDWGVRPEPWKHLLDIEVLERIAQAEQMLQGQFDEQVRQRVVYLRSREFHVQTSKLSLWFDMRSPVAEQIERYRLFLESKGKAAASTYVDLRLQDRIVYR